MRHFFAPRPRAFTKNAIFVLQNVLNGSVHTSSPPTVHTAYLRFLCDKCDCSSLDLDSWNSSWSIARLKEYLRRKRGHSRLPFKKAELPERQVSINHHLVYTLRVQSRCRSSKCKLKKKKPPGTNFACDATSSPCFQPASKSEWRRRHHLAQLASKDDGGGKHHAFSQCVYVLRTLTWETCGRKENTGGTAPAFGKYLAFLGFKVLADGRVHRLLGTSMKANIFLREDVLPMHKVYDRAVGDAEVQSVSLTNGK